MDRRTILAIAVSAAIFLGYILISTLIGHQNPKPEAKPEKTVQQVQPQEELVKAPAVKALPLEREIKEETKSISTKIFDITFSNKGGVVTSIKLKDPEKDPESKNPDDVIEMVYAYQAGFPEQAKNADEFPFAMRFGTYTTAAADDLFEMRQPLTDKKEADKNKIEFSRDFQFEGKPFRVTKTYEVVPDQYILKLSIRLDSLQQNVKPEDNYLPLNFDGVLYTLSIGPQIGPAFAPPAPDERSEYRKFVYLNNGGRNEQGLRKNDKPQIITGGFSWGAVMGKYYTVIASTDAGIKDFVLDARDANTQFLRSALHIERARVKTSGQTDEYEFYIGPKKQEILGLYQNKKYSEIAPVYFPFGTIAQVLKYPLDFFARVGNYGVAIIFLTILIKVLFYPLTRKSYDSMKKLQLLNPKLQELRTRYKSDPKKLNQEMSELYKREGVSPLGGCLPQLLQLPIMFGLYVLFNEYFGLKGAVFIPGWINDLSIAESVAKLPFTVPLLGWTNVRLLPFIMLGTQLISTFFTQGQSPSADSKMKFLPYILMGVFFFVLYDLPSGLVLYWTVQNILTVLQMLIQKYFSDRKQRLKMVQQH